MTQRAADKGIARPQGHDAVLERLERLRQGETLPHALVFVGPAGVGKFLTARWWVTRLKCERERCDGTCTGCKQIAAGTHLDVCFLEPEDRGKQIKIDPVRKAITALSHKPARTGPRVALVREAHLLRFESQSAMLKLLEEPPGSALVILVTENLAALMPTIRSRCQIFRFNPLAQSVVEELLVARGFDPDHAKRAAEVARGSIGRALELTAEALADHDGIVVAFERYRNGEASDLEGLIADLRERRKAGRPALDALFEWQLQKIESSLGRPPPIRSEALVPFLTDLGADDTRPLLALADRIRWTMVALDQNVNARIAIRDLLLDVRSP